MNERYVRKPYERERVQSEQGGESMTDQSAAGSTDINNIIKNYARTGVIPPSNKVPHYADVTELQGDLTDRIQWAEDKLQNLYDEAARRKLEGENEPPPEPTETGGDTAPEPPGETGNTGQE